MKTARVLLILAAIAGLTPLPRAQAAGVQDVTADQANAMFRAIRASLEPGLKAESAPLPSPLQTPLPCEGLLTLYCKGARVTMAKASGDSLAQLSARLGVDMGRALWRLSDSASALKEGTLVLDLIYDRKVKSLSPALPVCGPRDFGLIGLAVASDTPESSMDWTFVSPLDLLRFGQEPTLLLVLDRISQPLAGRVTTGVFRTRSFVESSPGGQALLLYRASPLSSTPGGFTQKDVLASLAALGGWLVATQSADPNSLAEYNPLTRRAENRAPARDKASAGSYDLALHLRIIEPLLRLYEITGVTTLSDAALQALRLAESQITTVAAPTGETPGKEPRPAAQVCFLGTGDEVARCTAVLLTAECRRAQVFKSGVSGLMRGLARALTMLINKDGDMGVSYRDLMRGDAPYEQQTDTPGRTIQALCMMYELDRNKQWLEAATRAGLARLAPRGGKILERGPWDVIGLAALYRAGAPEADRFCAGAYVHAAALLGLAERDRQWFVEWVQGRASDGAADISRKVLYFWPGQSPCLDYEGGFANFVPPRVSSAAQRLQAFAAVYKAELIKDPRDKAFRAFIRSNALPMAQFIVRHQYTKENTFYIQDPDVVIGAFRDGPADMVVRLNTNAECALALMSALEILALEDVADPSLPPLKK
ncbi:MAG TPA: hypothetical protein P5137_09270 [Candidatus Brocadiia bacterium]|nr:hypothetical protein [Candidatus Brocadiia bacterium]